MLAITLGARLDSFLYSDVLSIVVSVEFEIKSRWRGGCWTGLSTPAVC